MKPSTRARFVLLLVLGMLLAGVALRILGSAEPGPGDVDHGQVVSQDTTAASTDVASELADLGAGGDERMGSEAIEPQNPDPAPAAPTPPAGDVAPPPPGCLRISVSELGVPRAGLTLVVATGRSSWLEDVVNLRPSMTRHVLGADGVVEVCGLGARTHMVVVELGNGGTVQQRVRLRKDGGQDVAFRLGANGIYGRVTGWDRDPAGGALVLASFKGLPSIAFLTTANLNGDYSIDGLPAGPLHADSYFRGRMLTGIDDSRALELGSVGDDAAPERRRVDLGVGDDWVTLSGTVLASPGVAIANDGRRGKAQLRLRDQRDRRDRRDQFVAVDDGGGFRVLLPPGVYAVGVNLPGRVHVNVPVVDRLEVGTRDIERDFQIPGARITGTVDSWDPEVHKSREVVAFKEPRTNGDDVTRPVNDKGEFIIDGAMPGVWHFHYGHSEDSERATVTVTPGAKILKVTLRPI